MKDTIITRLRAEVEALKAENLRLDAAVLDWIHANGPNGPNGWIEKLRAEAEALRADAERFRFMRQNIDFHEDYNRKEKFTGGWYFHNQRGEFNYTYWRNEERPTFESVIDAARAAQGEKT